MPRNMRCLRRDRRHGLRRYVVFGVIAAWSLAVSRLPAQAQGLSDQEFHRLFEAVQRPAGEAWLTIPWRVSLLEAQRVAAAENKPIFIWAMDGHPLGCT